MANSKTGSDRLKKLPLWQWGVIVITASITVQAVMMAIKGPVRGPMTMAQRGEAMGQGVAVILMILVGIGLIVAHFVRRKK